MNYLLLLFNLLFYFHQTRCRGNFSTSVTRVFDIVFSAEDNSPFYAKCRKSYEMGRGKNENEDPKLELGRRTNL